ncbi:MAG: ROK family protein [Deltaproteobacteria bacterium]|nr:ROK family protein [Deltaproteobacteria bacterium]
MRYAIGADVGGTNIRVGLIDESGRLLAKKSEPVGVHRDPLPFFNRLTNLIENVAGTHLNSLSGIGLGLPGICNKKEGMIHQLPHFPSWRDVPVSKILSEKFSCPIFFDNDANMATLGELWRGTAKNLDSFIMLTLGTGIGGGLVLNRKLWQGAQGFAGEVGHMVIEVGGRACACGNKGCWEVYASSGAVPKETTAEKLSDQALAGDFEAKKFWETFGKYLGVGIANLASITGIENYVLAGGIAKAFPHFMEACKKAVRQNTYNHLAQRVVILQSTLDGDGNLLGAAHAVFTSSISTGAKVE